MYKVFLNLRLITIAAPGNITKNNPAHFFDKPISKEAIKSWFNYFINSNLKEVALTYSEPDTFFRIFRSIFTELPAAGGVVLRNDKLLFICRKKIWDLPKGKIDRGESAKEAALREVEEECGIVGHRITKSLLSTYHIYQSTNKYEQAEWIFKETQWFEMSYSGDNHGTPETAEEITRVKWFARNELEEAWSNTYGNLKQVIQIYRD